VAWPRLPRRAPWISLAALAALALDAFLPLARPAEDVAVRVAARVLEVQQRLAAEAEAPHLRSLLYPGGREAEPEAPFPLVEQIWGALPVRVDSLVLVDDHGLPVAWTGPAARLPVRLRPLGDRIAIAEPGVGSIWVWCREPVFEGGRPLGALLAGVAISEAGSRSVMGVWSGRGALTAAVLEGGRPLLRAVHSGSIGLELRPDAVVAWSAPGLAILAVLAVLAAGRRWFSLLAGVALVVLPALDWLDHAWWLVAGVAAATWLVGRMPRGWTGKAVGSLLAGAVGFGLPRLLELAALVPVPARLLWPGALRWALAAALAVLLRSVAARRRLPPWPLRLAAWLPFLFALYRPSPLGLGAALVVVTFLGLPRRSLFWSAVVAAGLLVCGEDVARRQELTSTTEATLMTLAGVQGPASSLLASLPEQALDRTVALEPDERLVVLGRLATWLNLGRSLPGTTLALADPSGNPAGVWGEAELPTEEPPRELATRSLRNRWQIAILAPPPPYDLLAGLAAAGVEVPLAVFDRSGAPTSRGAMFRPLSPFVVGKALAEGRSWGRVGVGEREFTAYLRARGDLVLAVPWVRPAPADEGLLIAAMTLWAVFPLAVWERRRRWRNWWLRRRTFAGKVRLLAVATAVLPVVLLGQFLPQQWSRQRAKASLELGRGISQLVASTHGEEGLSVLVRETGGAVAVYRSGRLASSTRPDLAAEGKIPGLAPAEAYVRSVRGWREPVIVSGEETDVLAPLRDGDESIVVAVMGLRLDALGRSPTPGEWFLVTAILAMMVALATAEGLGQRLARPLGRLVAAAHRLQRGQPVGEVETGGDEDVRALGSAFATMASEVQRREVELRRERDLLDSVLGTLSAAVLVADAGGGVELANAAAKAVLGADRQLAGLVSRFAPQVGALVTRARNGARAEETVHPLDSPESLWRVTVLPLASGGGRVLLVMEDLSEVARAERLSSLAELARIAAHEVKNPLTPIRLWAEELHAALERGPAAVVEVAGLAAQQILERVEHLREVAQGFSNLVALEHWEPSTIALGELAREVAAEYGVLAQRGVVVRLETEEAEVTADRQWVARALRHLLENSVRVLGGRRGEIVVTVRRLGGEVLLAVRDTGGGVPTTLLGRLFEPHFSTTGEGSGLGLAVVQRVAARAGGSAEAANVGGGLEVRLRFPAQPG